ncbi:MAG TPA: class I SAM-dependent methyltransferase, partial [Anaerolineales bacterium]|nr:class I SAM-dependent methyltransferase [Anaerolineales bacterium]
MQTILNVFPGNNQQNLTFLDIGAGTGFWTDLIYRMLSTKGYSTRVSALDVSSDALEVIRERMSHVEGIQENLATVSPGQYANTYDIVSAFYCLHHIVKTKDFINALQFSGYSVKPGGFFLVMDPILTRPYSKFDSFDLYSFHENGIPRHLYFIDDLLLALGLKRVGVYPAVSFILNGCIEASGPLGYFLMDKVWKSLCVLYRSESFVRSIGGILQSGDTVLKNLNLAFSSSLCLYQKVDTPAG